MRICGRERNVRMRILKGYCKGVNLGGWLSQGSLEKEHLDSFITEKDVEKIASWGCDHLRLPVDYENIENEDGSIKEAGYGYINNCISWCRKYKLNVVLDLHKTYGYTFDNQDASKDFFDNAYSKDRFIALWENLIRRYANVSDIVMFEPLNEVVRYDVADKWNELLKRCIKMIRTYAPTAKILIGGIGYNAPNAIEQLPDDLDENIVFNFHCYEPLIFTHQTAKWLSYMPEDFRMKYPSDYIECVNMTRKLMEIPTHMLNSNDPEIKEFGPDYFKSVFSKAVRRAESLNIPLYCGEYGVIDTVDTTDTLNWITDIHSAFEELGIGRAIWNYKGKNFGISDSHYDPIRSELIKVL